MTAGGRRNRIAADVGTAADLSARLANAEARLGTVHSELVELLADIDTAVGVGEGAMAFRRGFGPASIESSDLLRTAVARLAEHRRALTSGVESLAAADADAAAAFEPGDPR
ncbi:MULTISPECIES: hypothetical protein [Gordonia]|uniref:hypothetical protein n=1 Tax=Gordonia TaxID=2053 RepID=UPI00095F4436|nr:MULTISPECIES: hypothetical protein [Gordonia]AZZ81915.1 hypothetical protein C5O27_13245 [Gordonia alkanivorans]MDH3009647.1 hypothetical protein [Gordonia alkanivorans]MDJ0026654.1 hypothetical protein [Gordonia alkanivorans]OLT51818.1 hypothetical protein BJF87_15445 [Gordonia sp. CNJ-863]